MHESTPLGLNPTEVTLTLFKSETGTHKYRTPLKPCVFSSKRVCGKNRFFFHPLCTNVNQTNRLTLISDTVKRTTDDGLLWNTQSANKSADDYSQPRAVCSFNREPAMVRTSWCSGSGRVRGEKQESDEYAFHYCCNVMTGLMRSMESWASHFVVSPIHSPARGIHGGIVLRHIHSDGWMLLLMFQTTEHHSVPFLWFAFKHTGVLWWQPFCYSHMLHIER